MRLVKWEELPTRMQNEAVRPYYDRLAKKKTALLWKRLFDVVASCLLLLLLCPLFLILAIAIKLDSKGPVFYRQERVTQYGKTFRIHKFRSMVQDADRKGTLVTIHHDARVTRVGKVIRKCRLDEICQLIDVLQGNMTLVGTRPEVVKYVDRYAPVMDATLLLPAGITSEASILYKDEDALLEGAEDADEVYMSLVVPGKMFYNLRSIEQFSLRRELGTLFRTVLAVLGKDYPPDRQGEAAFAESLKETEKVSV